MRCIPVLPIWLVSLLAMGFAMPGCDGNRSGEPRVAVSIAPQAWLVQQLVGDDVEVIVLVSPGDSPHTHQPTDQQMTDVLASSVYFRVGVPFERGKWFSAIEEAGPLVVDTRGGIELLDMQRHTHHDEAEHDHAGDEPAHDDHDHRGHAHHHDEHDGKDPHIWTSPRLLKQQASTMAVTLGEVFPERREAIRNRLRELHKKLDALDSELRDKLQPVKGKAFFVFHPAWGYFAHEYGLKQIAIEIEGKSPTDHELTQLQTQAKAAGAKVIFVQPQITGKAAQAIADAIDGRVVQLDPLARDVAANLRDVADKLTDAIRDTRNQQPAEGQ